MQVEEVGNNRYRRKGTQEVVCAPNHVTAEKRLAKKLLDELKQEMYTLQQMLYHKGYRDESDKLREIDKIMKELNE